MKAYELLFFVDPTITDEARAGVMKRIEVALTENGGQVDNVDNWGKRKLAYEIDKLTEGDYTLVNFHADPTKIAELDRFLRINDAVKRHMIVCRPDHEEVVREVGRKAPSAAARRRVSSTQGAVQVKGSEYREHQPSEHYGQPDQGSRAEGHAGRHAGAAPWCGGQRPSSQPADR